MILICGDFEGGELDDWFEGIGYCGEIDCGRRVCWEGLVGYFGCDEEGIE